MKQIFLALLLIMGTVAVTAKDKEVKTNDTENTATLVLSGTVSDENSGEALVGVEVKIEGTDLKAYTDFDGNFSFENVKPGECKLVANYISYQKSTETLHVTPKAKEVKILLQTSK